MEFVCGSRKEFPLRKYLSENVGSRGTCYVSTVRTPTISLTVCVQPHRESWRMPPALSLIRTTYFDLLPRDRDEADDAAVEDFADLEVLLLCARHVHNVDRVAVRLLMFVSLVLLVNVQVHGIDKEKVNCLSSFCYLRSRLVPALLV